MTMRLYAQVALLTALTTSNMLAQTTPRAVVSTSAKTKATEPVSNADLVKMVAAGLSDDLIIGAIRNASSTAFDLSVTGLIKLKAGSVSDRVIHVLFEPSPKPAAVQPASPSGPTVPAAQTPPVTQREPELARREAGIYLVDSPDKLVALEPTVFSQAKGSLLASKMTWGIAKTKWKGVVRGAQAGIRTTSAQPTFYFIFENRSSGLSNTAGFSALMTGASSPNEFVLSQMYEKRDSREIIIGEDGAYSHSRGARAQDMVSLKTERLSPGVYRVTPTEALEAGEFCFFYAAGVSQMGGATAGKVFDFGVDAKSRSEP
jgi:hypothetical protein